MTDDIARIVRSLTKGARNACAAMTDDWQFAGKSTFNSNGAHALHWVKGAGGRGAICECEARKDGKWSRSAYRLTPFGLQVQSAVRAALQEEGDGA